MSRKLDDEGGFRLLLDVYFFDDDKVINFVDCFGLYWFFEVFFMM